MYTIERDMKAAIYARVSTADQNCERQLSELREYCARRKWDIAGEYVDTGFSGMKASRPELDRCMADARRRALVSLDWYGQQKTWLLTAYEFESPASAKGSIGVSGTSLAERGETPPPEAGGSPSTGRTMDVPGPHAVGRQSPPPGGGSTSNIGEAAGESKPSVREFLPEHGAIVREEREGARPIRAVLRAVPKGEAAVPQKTGRRAA